MSIENDLGRIATALEGLLKLMPGAPEQGVAIETEKVKTKKEKKEKDQTIEDAAEKTTAEKTITFVDVEKILREHNVQFNSKTRELMEKHGATKGKPTMSSIPEANWAAIYQEAKTDLKNAK